MIFMLNKHSLISLFWGRSQLVAWKKAPQIAPLSGQPGVSSTQDYSLTWEKYSSGYPEWSPVQPVVMYKE